MDGVNCNRNQEDCRHEDPRDAQITALRSQLEVMAMQLQDKDNQLSHYQQIVSSLQEILKQSNQTNSTQMEAVARALSPRTVRKSISFDPHSAIQTTGNAPPVITGSASLTSAVPKQRPALTRSQRRAKRNSYHGSGISFPTVVSNTIRSTGRSVTSAGDSASVNSRDSSDENSLFSGLASLPDFPSEEDLSMDVPRSTKSLNSIFEDEEFEIEIEKKSAKFEDTVGNAYAMSKYQQGCRFLQSQIDGEDKAHVILQELRPHLVEIANDPFGLFLFAKLAEECSLADRLTMVLAIQNNVHDMIHSQHGLQSVQRLLDFTEYEHKHLLFDSLRPSVISIIKHPKAHYFIQHCLEHLDVKQNQWIYSAVESNFYSLCRDRVGCVTIKKCVEVAPSHYLERYVAALNEELISLVTDSYANYVVQHVLEKHPHRQLTMTMILKLQNHLPMLCCQKTSSNVVEKCLNYATPEIRSSLLNQIANSPALPKMLHDKFANFVIQTCLDVATREQHQMLVRQILPHLGKQYTPYSKRLQKKLLQVKN